MHNNLLNPKRLYRNNKQSVFIIIYINIITNLIFDYEKS